MRPPPDCRPSVGASAPKGTCRWLSPFGGSVVRTALNYNYHRAAGRILCRRLKYATGYLLKLTPPSYKKASPAPIRTMKVRGNENWSEKSSISTREASPAPIRTMKVRANENWSEKSSISTRKASPAPIRTMKVRGNENWYEKSSISTSNRQPAPIRTMKVRGIENWYEKSSISTSNRQPVRGMVEKKKRSVRWIVDQYASGRPAGRGNTILGRPRVPPYSVPDVGSDRGILSGGMTDRLSDPVLGQKLLSGRGEWACHAWDDTDSSRPWGGGILGKRMAVGGGIFGMRPKYRDVPMGIDSTRLGWMVVLRWKAWIRLGCPELSKFTFCGCSWQPSFDGKWISAGSDTRLPVSCVSFALRLRYSQPRLDGPEYFGGVGERLMFLGQLNVRRMSGDRIASVCRLRARAPNYLPPILLSYFTGDVTLDDRIRGLFKKLVVEPWDGSAGPPLVCTGRLVPSVGDTLLVLIGRDFDPIVLAFGIGVMINRDSRGHSYFIVRERKLGARRRSDTVLVSTINDADQGSADVAYRTPLAPYEKSKFLGSGGSMVARLKLKGIDGRAPPGVCDALRCSGPHARYTDVFNEFTPWPTGPVSASHQLALTTSLPFVHTARRSYRLNDPVKCSDRGDVGGSPPATIIVDTCPKQNDPRTNDHHSRWAGFLTDPVLAGSVVSRIALVGSFISVLSCALLPDITKPRHEKCQGTSKRTAGIRLPGDGVCADAVLRYKNPVNHRVFERKLRPKPSGRGHVCLGVTNRRPLYSFADAGRKLVSRVLPHAVGLNPSQGRLERAPERVRAPSCPDPVAPRGAVYESGCLGMQPQSGGKFRPRLNTGERPIANKYRERIRKNPKNLTTSKVIDHTAVTVVDGKDVVVATITHPAVGTTITVDVDPIPAVVEGEDDVVFPNHNTRPNEYVIDVVLKGRGCGHYNSSGRGNHYNRGCRPNSGRGRGRGRCEGIELKDKDKKVSRDQYCIRLNKSLYGLKQSGRMWYNRLSDYLVREGYKNDPISPCIFIKKFANEGFVIIAVYVDDLNILGTSGEIAQTVEYLKKEFEMKDLGKTKFCLGLQLEYVNNGILVHQKAYTEKVLKRFNMDQAHPLSSPMVVRSLGLDSDPFGPKKDEEEVLGPEVPYLQCHRSVNAVFFKAQLLQHQRPSYLKTTQPVIAQLKDSYIKGDRTKHILPKFFFTHDLQRDGEVRVVQVRSSDNSADLFTKALPTSTLRKLTHQIGMRRLKDLQG
ncbi:Reverse transcriptase RNA-dependent DNA polymerase [Arabidopsis suecica]|uniref:Reverse transcriptase RNA-dependent DNA polymerase n=1 Tax=Arabidopsis suecica TaxID=45249 RepID=A0A8T1XC09_ARASU|nr:Reverse transcriptase RNA-dependent DNA polymerase [Arabidopsis suecica]